MRRTLAILCALMSVAFASPVLAQTAPNYQSNAAAGLQQTAEGARAYDTNQSSLVATVFSVVQAILGLLGIVFVILMIIAGVFYLSAQGEAARVEKAKSIITSAVIGTVIIVIAYAAVNYILKAILVLPGNPDAQFRQEQISTICTTGDACANDPLCFGTPECQQIQEGTVELMEIVSDPCNFDPGSTACIEQRAPQTLELCDEQPDLPLCCALYDSEDPRWGLFCSRVLENDSIPPGPP